MSGRRFQCMRFCVFLKRQFSGLSILECQDADFNAFLRFFKNANFHIFERYLFAPQKNPAQHRESKPFALDIFSPARVAGFSCQNKPFFWHPLFGSRAWWFARFRPFRTTGPGHKYFKYLSRVRRSSPTRLFAAGNNIWNICFRRLGYLPWRGLDGDITGW